MFGGKHQPQSEFQYLLHHADDVVLPSSSATSSELYSSDDDALSSWLDSTDDCGGEKKPTPSKTKAVVGKHHRECSDNDNGSACEDYYMGQTLRCSYRRCPKIDAVGGEERGSGSPLTRESSNCRRAKRQKLGRPSVSRDRAVRSQYEKKRREKINRRIRILQKLLPNSSETDNKTSLLDKAIQYIKQLQALPSVPQSHSNLFTQTPANADAGTNSLQQQLVGVPMSDVKMSLGCTNMLAFNPSMGQIPMQMHMLSASPYFVPQSSALPPLALAGAALQSRAGIMHPQMQGGGAFKPNQSQFTAPMAWHTQLTNITKMEPSNGIAAHQYPQPPTHSMECTTSVMAPATF